MSATPLTRSAGGGGPLAALSSPGTRATHPISLFPVELERQLTPRAPSDSRPSATGVGEVLAVFPELIGLGRLLPVLAGAGSCRRTLPDLVNDR